MNNTWMRRLLAAVIVVVGLSVTHSIASAQRTRYTCIFINGVKIVVIQNTNTATGSTGSGTFNPVGAPPPPQGPVNVNYTPAQIQVTANDPVNGVITTRLAPGPQPLTTIRSNGDARFPATGEIKFVADATISSKPGVFRSDGALVFKSTNLQSLPPFSGEKFTLDNDVTFTDPTGAVAFTLQKGSTGVTLGQGGGN